MGRRTLPMNLQLFAADPEDGAGAQAEETGAAGAAGAADVAGETSGGAVNQAEDKPAGEEKKDESGSQSGNLAGDVQKMVQEEMKKAAMTPEERAKYEAEEREKSLKEREEAVSLRERTADAKALLAENGLPASFTGMVTGKDAAETKKNVEAFKEQFDAAVQAQVEKRLSGRTPDAGSGVSGTGGGDALEDLIMSYL